MTNSSLQIASVNHPISHPNEPEEGDETHQQQQGNISDEEYEEDQEEEESEDEKETPSSPTSPPSSPPTPSPPLRTESDRSVSAPPHPRGRQTSHSNLPKRRTASARLSSRSRSPPPKRRRTRLPDKPISNIQSTTDDEVPTVSSSPTVASSATYSPSVVYSPYTSPYSSSSSEDEEELDYQRRVCPDYYHARTYYCDDQCNNHNRPRSGNLNLWNSNDIGWYDQNKANEDDAEEDDEYEDGEGNDNKENENTQPDLETEMSEDQLYLKNLSPRLACKARWFFLLETRRLRGKSMKRKDRALAIRKLREERIVKGAQKWEMSKVFVPSRMSFVESVDEF